MRIDRRVFLHLAWLFAACGGNSGSAPPDGAPDATVDANPPDAQPTRAFALASTGAQIRLDTGLGLYTNDLATDVDVVAIHQDFYGIPWDEFRTGAPLPTAWVAAMDELVHDSQTLGTPVFLSLALVQGPSRHFLADKASTGSDGKLKTTTAWSAECYDFSTAADGAAMRAAYVAYVKWMIDRFDPKWVNVAVEINLFDTGCSDSAWNALVDTERAAYEAAKAEKPGVIAFPSIQADFLYGMEKSQCPSPMKPSDCYDANYARLARLERDRFAISTYPYLIDAYADVAQLPDDWFTRGAVRGGERLVIAETGWLATNAVGTLNGACVTPIAEAPPDQLTYFDDLVRGATAGGADLITWWSNRDVEPTAFMTDCPCTFDQTWCGLIAATRAQAGSDPTAQFYAELGLKIFGTMGLRDYDGNPRAAFFDRWRALRAMPIAP